MQYYIAYELYVAYSLVPRPLPVSNVTREKREGLGCEITFTSFRWKGDYRAWAGDRLQVVLWLDCTDHCQRLRK